MNRITEILDMIESMFFENPMGPQYLQDSSIWHELRTEVAKLSDPLDQPDAE